MPRHDYFSPWRIWKEMKKGEGRVSQEFLPSLAWFYAWQVVSLFLFFFFIFLLFEDQTRRAVSWFTSSRMNSKGVFSPFFPLPPPFLSSPATIWRGCRRFASTRRHRATISSYQTVKEGGKAVPAVFPTSPFNFPRVFSPNYDPIHFSGTHRKREIDLERVKESNCCCVSEGTQFYVEWFFI